MKSLRILSTLVFVLSLAACGDHAQDPLNQVQSSQVKEIIRQALQDDPKLVVDALQAYQKQTRDQAAENTKKALQTNAADLYNNPASPVMGNPNGDVTIVEFFDYNCGYCKSVFHPIRDAILQDGNIRFVFKDFPILGDSSLFAAKAALAAGKQGKYVEYHTALMDHRGPKDDASITAMATKLGLDLARFKADMNSPEIQQQLEADIKLGQTLGVNGTPAFVVGDKFYPGALDADSFKKLVQDFRQAKANPAPAPAAPAAAPVQAQ